MFEQARPGLRRLAVFVLGIALFACFFPAAPKSEKLFSERAAGEFRQAECPFEVPRGVKMDCGYLTVPENRSNPDAPNIDLAVAILHAKGGDARPDPIVYLAGGPGDSALDDFISKPDRWLAYSFERDLIFVDQRGTGYSIPTLNCPEVEEIGFEHEHFGSEDLEHDALVACHGRLVNKGIDLTAYNTVENAADIAELRQALGYEEWNILGISYGTRLALAVMRDHPQGIRSVVLDLPFPPNVDLLAEGAVNGMSALRVLFKGCASDPLCDEAYPNLEEVLLETVERLNDEPVQAVLTFSETGKEYDLEIYGDDLVFALKHGLRDVDSISLMPRMIYEVSEGNYDDTFKLIVLAVSRYSAGFQRPNDEEDRNYSEGMYWSVICRDEYTFSDYSRAERHVRAEIPEELQSALFGYAASDLELCEIWGAGKAAPIEDEPVVSDIPTLILVGEYDPVTPPRWGKLAAETLSNSYYFEFPGFGHSVNIIKEGCPVNIVSQFLNDPTTKPDGSCVKKLHGPEFSLPDEEIEF
jgi:pimeloyl-ACP methyl ester carboxylesterase